MPSGTLRTTWRIIFNYLVVITASIMVLNQVIIIATRILPFTYDLSRYIEYAGIL